MLSRNSSGPLTIAFVAISSGLFRFADIDDRTPLSCRCAPTVRRVIVTMARHMPWAHIDITSQLRNRLPCSVDIAVDIGVHTSHLSTSAVSRCSRRSPAVFCRASGTPECGRTGTTRLMRGSSSARRTGNLTLDPPGNGAGMADLFRADGCTSNRSRQSAGETQFGYASYDVRGRRCGFLVGYFQCCNFSHIWRG